MSLTRSLLATVSALLLGCSNASPGAPADSLPPNPDATSEAVPDSDAAGDAATETGPPACVHPEVVQDCSDGWCRIPAGCYVMGSPPGEYGRGRYSETQVQVTLTRAFLIQQHELTQAEWIALGLDNPSTTKPYLADCSQPDCPVGNVNYLEAMDFANAMSESKGLPACYAFETCHIDPKDGMVCEHVESTAATVYDCKGYRLPTDAEWEYAARAGTTTAFYSGDIVTYDTATLTDCRVEANLEPIAWYCANSGDPCTTHPVMQKVPNAWGLYDMLGNAGEWVSDRFRGLGHGTEPLVDPDGAPTTEASIILRGGLAIIWASYCRAATRVESGHSARDPGTGLRLVRTLHDPS